MRLLFTTIRCALASVLIFSGPVPKLAAKETKVKKTEFGAGVQTGVYLTKYHDSCIYFRAFFVSDNFFVDLRTTDTPAGTVFKKGTTEYRTFPEKLILDVEATVISCSDPPDTRIILDKSIGLLGSLSFETNWKLKDSDLPKTVVVPTKIEHPVHGIRWDFFLEVPAKDIPLAADLVACISARENIQLATIWAHLK